MTNVRMTNEYRLVSLVIGACLLGCSSAPPEPTRYHLSGKVTHEGKPVPAGTIYIDPKDGGPQGYAEIKSGQFDTRDKGKGHGGGPAVLRVAGYDGVAANELPLGQPLFPEKSFVVELPKSDGTHDLETTKETPLAPGPAAEAEGGP